MPQITVTASGHPDTNGRAVTLTERVTARDFESRHFQTQLVERISWAVGDAQVLEERAAVPEREPEAELSRRAPEEADRQRRSANVLTTAS
jgi:hypothetical protein